jgi:uncharacterized RDD family membrane protein YckC
MGNTSMKYTKFVRRLIACLIDLIIIIVIYAVVLNIELGIYKAINNDFDLNSTRYFYPAFVLMVLSSVTVIILYFSVLEASNLKGGFGKVLMKIYVVDNLGHKLKFKKSFIRALLKCISIGIFITYISVIFTKEKRTLYDFILGTYVINLQETVVSDE